MGLEPEEVVMISLLFSHEGTDVFVGDLVQFEYSYDRHVHRYWRYVGMAMTHVPRTRNGIVTLWTQHGMQNFTFPNLGGSGLPDGWILKLTKLS